MITEMNVDLPVPLRPTRPTFSPAPTTNEASLRRVRSPISIVREEPTIIRGGGDRGNAGAFARSDDGGARRDQPHPLSHRSEAGWSSPARDQRVASRRRGR